MNTNNSCSQLSQLCVLGLVFWVSTLGWTQETVTQDKTAPDTRLLSTPRTPQSTDGAKRGAILVEGALVKTMDVTSVSAQVAGQLVGFSVTEGSRVVKDSEIANIKDSAVRLQIERAKIAMETAQLKMESDIDVTLAQKNKAVSENEYRRALDANRKVPNAYSVGEVERLQLIYDRTILELDRARFQQALLERELAAAEVEWKQFIELQQRHRIQTPCTGIVIAVEKRLGEWVEPGTVVVKVLETDRYRIEGFIPESEAYNSLVGSEASIQIADGTKFTGSVIFLSQEINPLNAQARVVLEVKNPGEKLRPGLRPRVEIYPESVNDPSHQSP